MTRRCAQMLLKYESIAIIQLYETGMLEENEYSHILELIENKLFSLELIEQHKKGKTGFIRNRKLIFMNLVLFILQQGKSSLQRELEKYFTSVERGKKITAGVFTHARKKLCPDVFVSLSDVLVESFYLTANSMTTSGIRRILT